MPKLSSPAAPAAGRARSLGLAIALITLAAAACGDGAPSAPAAAADYIRGPHGGRMLGEAALQIEVTIYERGVPPEFRVYPYVNGKPVPPAQVSVRINLLRHGGRLDPIAFAPQGDYLLGDKEIVEPHSFDVEVIASMGAQSQTWTYASYEGRVELSDEAVQTSAIKLERVGPAKMKTELELPGEVKLNADKLAHVVPRLAGVMRTVHKSLGDPVKQGEVIAVLESRDLAELRRALAEASQQVEFAKRAFEREDALLNKGIASQVSYQEKERDLKEAELQQRSARQQLSALGAGAGAGSTSLSLRAPFDGVVIAKNVAIGQAVKDDEALFTIADLSTLWVDVSVYARDLGVVKEGQAVTITAQGSELAATGVIGYVGALVGEATRSAMARVILPDAERRWRAGMFVTVQVVQEAYTAPVAVKREALQTFRDWDVVFVRAGNTFEARPLELGRTDGDWVEIVSGLAGGETYATANSFVIKADIGKSGASHDH